MCDLIDLNSPDTNKVLKPELASPLIPSPPGAGSDEPSHSTNGLPNLMSGKKRSSLDNNPFDQVFKETAEYVRKKEDPFEIVLEKTSSSKKSKRRSVEFKDDFIPKQTKHAEVLKMNKTLDESVIDIDLNTSRSCLPEKSIIEDLDDTNFLNDNSKNDFVPVISIQIPSPGNTSILNYSAMDDSLVESDSAKETAIRSLVAQRVSMCIQKGIMEAEGMLHPNHNHKLTHMRRSLSQTDRLSPKKFEFRQRSHSIIDNKFLRKHSRSERSTLSSMPSIEFDDEMNKAFLQGQLSANNSVFSDLSNISEISRIASVSSAYNSSISLYSNATMNQAFIRSGSLSTSQRLTPMTFSPSNSRRSIRSDSTSTIGSLSASEIVRNDISDLQERFTALKMKLSQSSGKEAQIAKGDVFELSKQFKELKANFSENEVNSSSIREGQSEIEIKEDKKHEKDEKLIDVELYVPPSESTSSGSKTSFLDSSSDSVFTQNSRADKSILSEARKLAKTFEEMADDKSSLETSGYDLLSSHMRFDFEQLPESDDEAIVDNLIDLPSSPSKPEAPPNSPTENEGESPLFSESQKEKNNIREIETEFTEPKDPEKKIMAISLLLELEKLIKTEKNTDAEKLLNELEKVLGVKWENNTELLATYLENAKSNMQINKDDSENNDEDTTVNRKSDDSELIMKNISQEDSNEGERRGLKRKNTFLVRKGTREIGKIQYPSRMSKSLSNTSLDSASKIKPSPEKSMHSDSAVSRVTIKNNAQLSKERLKSGVWGVRKRFSSDPNFVNTLPEKKQTDSTTPSMKKSISSKEAGDKPIPVPEIQKSTISNMADAVRNKLKHKSDAGVSKKGPMKATIPFGNIQKRASFGKKVIPVAESGTPPKASPDVSSVFTVTSSTPNTSIKSFIFKKSKSKPVASSTPDPKEPKSPMAKPPSPHKRNFPCNISPVPALSTSGQDKSDSKDSPKEYKMNTSPSRRPSTPKARRPPSTPSGIPKYSPRPNMQRRRSLNDLNKSERYSTSSQLLLKTPNAPKLVENKAPKSPLRSINKVDLKTKSFNLISKLRRRGNEYSEAEKENYS